MEQTKVIRTRWLTFRLSLEEERKIVGYYKRTTCQSLSEYARNVLLKLPVTVKYRNESADAFLSEMIALKKELHAVSQSMQNLVHQLQLTDNSLDIKIWKISLEKQQQLLLKKAEDIRLKMHQIYQLWLQK